MEHESFVPTPLQALAAALRTPSALEAALPGWQPDAPEQPEQPEFPATGRLRLRVAGSTITYRGTVKATGDASPYTLEAEGTEVRGTGTVKAAVEVTLAQAAGPEAGTTLTWRGTAQATGRLAAYESAVVDAAIRRLLDRFATALAENAPAQTPAAEEEPDVVDDTGLDDFGLVEVEVEVPESAAALDDLVPPAEAAHARRTMIGRSAEEVDHAPPRGRYAPVPAPDTTSATATLRWAAPAAAALLASAVVVGRVLRRRK